MKHSFEVEIAKEYGINCAILLDFIHYWVSVNKANDRNFHDGSYWTYNTVKAFEELFPYMTKKQIRSTLDKLETEGLIYSGNYNNSAYDRTKWYTVTEKGLSVFPKRHIELPCRANGSDSEGNPIPINIPTNNTSSLNTNINSDLNINKKTNKFIIPSIKEIDNYCIENNYEYVNPESFYYYYESNGWMVGKQKMKNWHRAVAGWNARAKDRGDRKYIRPKVEIPINTDRPERFRTCPDSTWSKLKPFASSDGSFNWSDFDQSVLTDADREWMRKNDM